MYQVTALHHCAGHGPGQDGQQHNAALLDNLAKQKNEARFVDAPTGAVQVKSCFAEVVLS